MLLSLKGQAQRKGVSPAIVQRQKLKYVNNVSCVGQSSFVQLVPNVQTPIQDLLVGARLHLFWETWEAYGGRPKGHKNEEGYTLPFLTQPNLTRARTILSCYANPLRNLYLIETLHALITKNAVKLVKNQKSLFSFTKYFWSQNQTISGDLF